HQGRPHHPRRHAGRDHRGSDRARDLPRAELQFVAMALELKQTVKLTQSLVMTPQLQQAIKLLQLSRLELQNTIQQELVENPVLEEALEEDAAPQELVADEHEDGTASTATDVQAPATPEVETTTPTTDDMVGDLDWESYMESKPQTSLSRGDDDRPALDANLTPATSLN